jgi:hypothetical protein
LSDAMNLLAALRQLGRFLLMPFSATAAGSAVLALWRSGGWLLRRGFSIGTSVVLKKCCCAGRRLWPQMKCRGRHQRRGVLALSAQPGCTTSISTRKT